MLTANDTPQIRNYSETPLEDLLQEMSQNREDFITPEPKPIDDASASMSEKPDAPVTPDTPVAGASQVIILDAKELKGKRENTAKWLGKNTDRAMAFITSLIADTDDIEEWKAEPDDLKDIIDCYFEMCEGYGWTGLPPWLNLAMCIGFTYGPQMREAFKIRGINKAVALKAAQAEADNQMAQAELRRIKLEQEKAKIQQQPVPTEKLEPVKTDSNIDNGAEPK
ncbi:MAG: hypothetical protein WCP32_10360 [Bacteroidota bacterium]